MSYEQKAIVKIDSDGAVAKCAKGLAGGECGYKAGSKVCGKCGAMAVEVKMVPVNEIAEAPEDEMSDEEYKQMMRMRRAKKEMGMNMDDDMEDEEDDAVSNYLEPMKKGGMGVRMPMMDDEMMDDEMMDDEEDMEPMATPKGMRWGKRMMSYKEEDEEMMEGEDEDEEMMEDEEDEDEMDDVMPMRPAASGMAPDLEAARLKRLRSLGTKSADIGLNGFMCAIERKVYPGSISVCDDCPGGCVAEKGLPGLLHVEGLAETMFKGDVIDSGYSSEADMFVVDVQTKSGYVNEVFIDGTTAEVLGFHRLDDSIFEQKSLMDDIQLIDFNEAAEIAVKSEIGRAHV